MHGRNPVRTTTFFRTPNERPCAKPISREQTSTSRLHRQTSALASPTIRRSPRATQTWVPQDVAPPVMCDDSDDEDYHDEGGCADGQNDYGDDSNNKTVMLHSAMAVVWMAWFCHMLRWNSGRCRDRHHGTGSSDGTFASGSLLACLVNASPSSEECLRR